MKLKLLADTGVFVSEVCFGTMTFGGSAGIHRFDPLTSFDDTLRSLDALV